MEDKRKTKRRLIRESGELCRQVGELEAPEIEYDQARAESGQACDDTDEASAKEGVLSEIEEAMERKPEEYVSCFSYFNFVADKESGNKNHFAEVLDSIWDTLPEPLLIRNEDLKIFSADRPFYGFFKATPRETAGDLIHTAWGKNQKQKGDGHDLCD